MDAFAIKSTEFWQQQSSFLWENERAVELRSLPEPSMIFATSGSTGVPRRIVLSQQNLLTSAAAVNAHLAVNNSSVWGLCLPLWHVGGFAVPTRAYQADCQLAVWSERWQPERVHDWLVGHEVSHLSLVPTQVHDLIALGKRSPRSLRSVVVGGGRLDLAIGQRARDLGWPVLASYGMTEACSQIATQALAALDQPYSRDELTILPCWDVRQEASRQLAIRGPALYAGLWQDDGVNGRFIARNDEWYVTQDHGVVDQGLLSQIRRADDLVKILGELVSPVKIESQLADLGLPSGRFVVLAIADERKQHRLQLIHESLDANLIEQTLARYHQQARGYERIDGIRVVALLPRSALGKILRKQLTEMI